jgi:hypothetical protein
MLTVFEQDQNGTGLNQFHPNPAGSSRILILLEAVNIPV